MFGRAKVKRFNEEGSCAPAPNAYDAKLKESSSGTALPKSQRFEDSKYVTPGPGEYAVPGALGTKAASRPNLLRSASFRLKKTSLMDLTGSSVSSTPAKTPRKQLRRSNSFCQLSSSKPTKNEEMERLNNQIVEQENQIAELNSKLSALQDAVVVQCEHENTDIDVLREKLESVEAELETCKAELSYRTQLVDELEEDKEKLHEKCEGLTEKSDRVESLRDEVALLTQDNSTLEEEIVALRQDRRQAEEELEEMRTKRSELEEKSQEDDAKNIFLHFTQEQLNTQVVGLESVLSSLKQENHLLSQGLKKMVGAVQDEKSKNLEITEAYMKENADAELEFNKLHNNLSKATDLLEKQTLESKNMEVELRAQILQLSDISQQLHAKVSVLDGDLVTALRSKDDLLGAKDKFEADLAEALRDLEVSENDKSVLRDSLKSAEKENAALTLDLGEATKHKLAGAEVLLQMEEDMEAQLQRFEDARSEVHDLEMTRAGLEGAAASLREEMGQLEVNLSHKTFQLEEASSTINRLETRVGEQEDLLEENKVLIAKMEELSDLQQERETNLSSLLCNFEKEVEEMRGEKAAREEEITQLKVEVADLTADLTAAEKDDVEKQASIDGLTGQLVELELKTNHLETELEEKKDSLAELLQTFLAQQQDLERVQQEKLAAEESSSKKDDLVTDLQTKLDELKMSREEIEESLLDTQELVSCMETKLDEAYKQHKEEADTLSRELGVVKESLNEVRAERAKLIEINTDLTSQVSESLHAIGNLQVREEALGNSCQEYAVQLELLHEEGERDRIRLLQAEEEIGSLQGELEASLAEIGDMEAAKIQLREKSMQLETQLDQFKTAYRQVQDELAETRTVGRELYLRVQELEVGVQDQEQELNTWKQTSHDKENEIQLLTDNIKHLEALRDNLELNVSEKTDLLTSLRDEMNIIREAHESDKTRYEETSKLNLRLKGNIEVHLEEVRSLRKQLDTNQAAVDVLQQSLAEAERRQAEGQVKLQEAERRGVEGQVKLKEAERRGAEGQVKLQEAERRLQAQAQELQQKLMDKVEKIADLETDREEKERIRMKEMEMLMQLRGQIEQQRFELEGMRESVERGESAERSMEAQQRVLCEAEGRAAAAEELVEKWRSRMEDAENIMKVMERKLEEEEESNRLLQEMIEPFKDQLESFEIEKNALLCQSSAAQDEVKKLATQYGSLLGHQNQKQKIQHVVKIKQENVELKAEISALREQLAKNKKTMSRMEDRLQEATGSRRFDPRLSFQTPGNRNKENSMLCTPLKTPAMGPPTRDSVHKTRTTSRGSVSSPLKNKN